jgi:hypothetical protein
MFLMAILSLNIVIKHKYKRKNILFVKNLKAYFSRLSFLRGGIKKVKI